jgi:hypothetical protein
VPVQVVTDEATLRPRTGEGRRAAAPPASVSPTGKRAVFEARGDVFTVPAEHGPVVNLTRSLGRRGAVSALVARRQDGWPTGATAPASTS